MNKKNLKILLLFDVGETPPLNQDFSKIFKLDDWKLESQLTKTLKVLGHEVKPFGIFDDIIPLAEELKTNRPDLVFNLCEAFNGNRKNEPHIAALLELYNIPFTGAKLEALLLCKDKGLTKKILNYHKIQVPKFLISKTNQKLKKIKNFTYPAFIKPLNLESSEGIAQLSFVESEKEALDRVHFLHNKYQCDVIIEEYIEGREIYVSLIGNERIKVLPPRELFFDEVPEGLPKFATYKAKWDENYRKKWGIRSGFSRPIEQKTQKQLFEICKKIYKLFKITGYARIDLRITEQNEIYFIEANPNPSIAKDDDFILSCEKFGLKYESVLEQIIQLALYR